jgi:argonaute-like protein implicated in RNA metabolism and viral defense
MEASFQLSGEYLPAPFLRFDHAQRAAVHKSAYSGISLFGPYDKSLVEEKGIKIGIIFPGKLKDAVGRFSTAFKGGSGRYGGFERWYRLPIEEFIEFPTEGDDEADYEARAKEASKENPDLVFVVADPQTGGARLYPRVKALLLETGVPSQFINTNRLFLGEQLQWILANVSLAGYAKIGNTPWVIEGPEKNEIVLGMSRTIDAKKNVIVGFTVVFKQNGDFVLSQSESPVSTWDDYEDSIEDLVTKAIRSYSKIESTPESLVFHFSKRTGRREVLSVKRAIENLGLDIKYAIVHINSTSSFRAFDTSDPSYVPLKGLRVKLSARESVLLFDGRTPQRARTSAGTPNVYDVTIDANSTIEKKEYFRVFQQIFNLSFVNWRGLNAKNIPVTINYSNLLARLLGEIGDADEWSRIVAQQSLKHKAWFL